MNCIISLFYHVRYDTDPMDHLYFMGSHAYLKQDIRLVLLEEQAVGNPLLLALYFVLWNQQEEKLLSME
jgi:hypothetical protein